MTSSGFTVVIDLGTSQIRGIMGRKNENGVISVIAGASVNGSGINEGSSIRRGKVHNLDLAGASVAKLIQKLENSSGRKIGKAYVSLAGQSLHTIDFSAKRYLSSGIVTDEDVKQLRKAAEKHRPDLKQNYCVADVEYYIDGKPEKNPVGIRGKEIEAGFKLLVGRPGLTTNIKQSITSKTNLEIADYVVGPLAAAVMALTDEEKELGCALIDFGAGTTTLSIYKKGILRWMVEIPFGGDNITRDISELNFTEEDAERLKTKFGKAMDNREGSIFSSPFSSKPDADLEELNKVIVMRLDEIIANIRAQISLSGYEDQLGGGVIITGGASMLKNLDLYLAQELKMEVRKASVRKTMINNASELINNPSFTSAFGMLLSVDGNCERIVQEQQEEVEEAERSSSFSWPWGSRSSKNQKDSGKKKKPKKEKSEGGFAAKMGDLFGEIFTEDDE